MEAYRNIAITGARQAGKSTLARWVVEKQGVPPAGFQTLRYALTPAGPLYVLEDLRSQARAPISHLTPEGIRGIPESFQELGARILAEALASSAPVVLLDEIGRFERNSPAFLAAVTAVLDSPKQVVAVLKKEDLPYIRAILARRDTLVIDLDVLSRQEARALLMRLHREGKLSF